MKDVKFVVGISDGTTDSFYQEAEILFLWYFVKRRKQGTCTCYDAMKM